MTLLKWIKKGSVKNSNKQADCKFIIAMALIVSALGGIFYFVYDMGSNRGRFVTVRLQGHLDGNIQDDPMLKSGESVIYIPNTIGPFASKDPVAVQLPGNSNPIYLNGYVIGYAGSINRQFQ